MPIDPLICFSDRFQLFGDVVLTACPLCGSIDIGELWRLPQNRLAARALLDAPNSPAHGTYLEYLPTLQVPQQLYKFDICADCETIFLNPKRDDQASYVRDSSKVTAFRTKGPDAYQAYARNMLCLLPDGATRVVDAACGAGQVLHLMRTVRPDLELIGLELSRPCVDFINEELGISAHVADLDRDDLSAIILPESVDFIIFQEAYEHVRSPLVTMKGLMRLLRPGGRIHFTAQYWGDNPLQIRVAEPIYISEAGFDYTIAALGMSVIEFSKDIKFRATIEKPH